MVVAALLIAVALQAATGFGFALLAGPSLYSVMEPERAVALLLILGLLVNVLVLGGERRRLQVDWGGLKPAMLAALPGLPIGALLVRVLPADALRVAIGVIVCTLVAHRLLRRAPAGGREAPGRVAAATAGFSAGVLTTSTTTNGPPLALWLGGRGLAPAVVRDTVSAAFLLLDFVGIGVVLAVLGPSTALAEAIWLPGARAGRHRGAPGRKLDLPAPAGPPLRPGAAGRGRGGGGGQHRVGSQLAEGRAKPKNGSCMSLHVRQRGIPCDRITMCSTREGSRPWQVP